MALSDDIPVVGDVLSGGNWLTGLAIGIGALVTLPLAASVLRPLAKTAIKGGLQTYRGTAGWVSDLVSEAVAESAEEVIEEVVVEVVEVTAEVGG